MDSRSALEPGTELWLQEADGFSKNQYRFRIVETVGMGASCITYNAIKYGSCNTEHWVRLKECYPYFGCSLIRDKENRLVALQRKEKWIEKRQQFEETYKNHTNIQKELGLMNSSAEVSELLEGNQTLYMVIKFDEGKDYAQVLDRTVRDTLSVAEAVAQVLEIYHKKGYLYLDLKPENILILPETREHIKLLDFDSVIKKEQLFTDKEQPLILSGTQGYSAPELHRDVMQISECSDIYSVGAVVFARLMGRMVEGRDGERHTNYDFQPIKQFHKNLQPDFFQNLEEFFRKTIAISVRNRYGSMKEVREKLKKLIALADETEPFVLDNFISHQIGFVGREQELKEIEEHFEKNFLLFLHGIGGIGKTELARQYAEQNREKYRTILFLNYQNSLLETICSKEVRIANLKQGKEETEEAFFNRKLKVMQEYLQPNDLLILDNFDVKLDSNFDQILKCNCRILVTSREDFLDWQFPQMEVGEIQQMEKLLELFCSYQREADWYQEREWKAVESLIIWAECHTMTIALMAKYLRISRIPPYTYWESLQKREGIISTGSEEIKHRKDCHMTMVSVERHLQAVFDLSKRTEQEMDILRSLSLLGNTRIRKDIFLRWCQNIKAETIEALSESGWILYEKETKKVALHQIILDMVYAYLKPDSNNCANITESIIELMKKKWDSRVEERTIKRLVRIIGERLQGNDLRLVRFYLNYCSWIGEKEEYLKFCISYCQEYKNKKELLEAYCCYGEFLWKELTEHALLMEEKEQIERADRVVGFFDKAIQVLDGNVLFETIETGKRMDRIRKRIEKLLEDTEFSFIEDRARQKLSNFLEQLETTIRMETEERIKRKEKIEIKKEFYFLEKGQDAAWHGNYKKAIYYYQREITEKGYEEFVLPALAEAYEKEGDWQDAVFCYTRLKKLKEDSLWNIGDINQQLIRLHWENGEIKQAIEYCQENIEYQTERITNRKKKEKGNALEWEEEAYLVDTFYKRYQITGKKEDWEEAVRIYRKQENTREHLGIFLSFLKEYAKIGTKGEDYDLLSEAERIWENLGDYYMADWEWNEAKESYQQMYRIAKERTDMAGIVRALFKNSKVYLERYQQSQEKTDWNKAWNCCKEAWQIAEGESTIEKVQKMRILDWFGELYNAISEYEKGDLYRKQCDYKWIAREESKGKSRKEAEQIWFWAAEQLIEIQRIEEAICCLEEIKEPDILEQGEWTEEAAEEVEQYLEKKKKEIECFLKSGKKEEARKYLEQITDIFWKQYFGIFDIPSISQYQIRRLQGRLKGIAWLYKQCGDCEESIRLLFLYGILQLRDKEKKERIERITIWEADQIFYQELEEKREGKEWNGKLFDEMIALLEQVIEIAKQEEEFSAIAVRFEKMVRIWTEEMVAFK